MSPSERFNRITLILLAAAAIVLALLHLTGLLDLPWIHDRLQLITLVLLGLVAAYLAFETTGALSDLPTKIAEAERAKQIRYFDNIGEVYEYTRDRMAAAKTIDDLTWGPRLSRLTSVHQQAYATYRQEVLRLSARPNLTYREIMTFPDIHRVDDAAALIAEQRPAYQLRYYDVSHDAIPPLIRFILIDDEVIFVHNVNPGLPEEGASWIAVRHPRLLDMAKVYFAEAWSRATPVTTNVLSDVRRRLSTQVVA